VVFDRGPLRHAVVASCSMPGMALPYPDGDRLLIDGGVVAEVPVEQARAASRRPVVAIDTPEDVPDTLPDRPSVPRAFVWADTLTHRALRRRLLAEADLVIAPVVAHVHWAEFARLDEMMQAGKVAASARLSQLVELARSDRRALPTAAPASE
jgi:NTE family protein